MYPAEARTTSQLQDPQKMAVPAISYGYGVALLLGGIAGAAKGSLVSLLAAGASAALVLGLEASGPRSRWATAAAVGQLSIATALLVVMARRYAASGKVMPAGLTAVLSGVALLAYASRVSGLLTAAGPAKIKA